MHRPVKTTRAGRNELDAMVVNIELTLSSIIQGVALYFLTANAHVALEAKRWTATPYIAVGLVLILLFWSRSLIHTLTLIRWPLEFPHNFFYIACTLVEAIAFTRLTDPSLWFAWNALFAALVWAVFVYDLRIIRMRKSDSRGEHSSRLYELVTRDQWLNIIFLVPAILLFNLAAATAIHARPDLFIFRRGHLALIAIQGLGFVGYLAYVIRAFMKLTPLIAGAREEWRAAEAIDLEPEQE